MMEIKFIHFAGSQVTQGHYRICVRTERPRRGMDALSSSAKESIGHYLRQNID
ncbi:hypothetical protein OAH23_07040 [Verrucomicrobia bacterium]|nr:hypothetical protein [Verrucomicrobiota bacterium]